MNFFWFIVGLASGSVLLYCFPEFFGLKSWEAFVALKKSELNLRWRLEDEEERVEEYHRLLAKSQGLTQDAIMKLAKAHRDNATYRIAKSNLRHWEDAARELERRIAAFQLQQQKIKKAYCEDVFRISHGQATVAALRDPEKYLVSMEDGSYMTAAEILRRAEIVDVDSKAQLCG